MYEYEIKKEQSKRKEKKETVKNKEKHINHMNYLKAKPQGMGVLQKASDYTGILPQHELLGGDYEYGGRRKNDFTYHHIIPENFLNSISDIINERHGTNTNEAQAFKKAALEFRKETRIKNTYLALKKRFPVISFDENFIKDVLNQNKNFDTVMDKMKRKVLTDLRSAAFRSEESFSRKLDGVLRTEDETVYNLNIDDEYKLLIESGDLADILLTKGWFTSNFQETGEDGKYRITIGKEEFIQQLKERIISVDQIIGSFNDSYIFIDKDYGINSIIKKYLTPPDKEPDYKNMIAWLPGNIHRGPASDIRSKKDDGGDDFEVNAANVVEKAIFDWVRKLYKEMENLKVLDNRCKVLENDLALGKQKRNNKEFGNRNREKNDIKKEIRSLIKNIFSHMTGLFDVSYTGFDNKKWQEVVEGGKRLMATKPHAK